MSREGIMELQELEYINSLTAPRAERSLRIQRVVQLGCRAGVFLAGLLLGLAL